MTTEGCGCDCVAHLSRCLALVALCGAFVCVGAQLKDAHNVAALLRDNAALMEAVLKDVLSDSDSPLENEEQGEMRKLYFAREPLEGTPRYGSTLDTVNRDEGGYWWGN